MIEQIISHNNILEELDLDDIYLAEQNVNF